MVKTTQHCGGEDAAPAGAAGAELRGRRRRRGRPPPGESSVTRPTRSGARKSGNSVAYKRDRGDSEI